MFERFARSICKLFQIKPNPIKTYKRNTKKEMKNMSWTSQRLHVALITQRICFPRINYCKLKTKINEPSSTRLLLKMFSENAKKQKSLAL